MITGGNGFVGRHLQAELRKAWPDAKVVSWDLPEVDITKPETYTPLLDNLKPLWVIHLAAIASVPAALKDPGLTRRINTEGTRLLLEAIQSKSKDTKFLFVSTADIYGHAAAAAANAPISELPLADAKPANAYAESKLEAEKIIEGQYDDRCIRVRPFPHIGPGQGIGFVTADFASQIAAIEAGKQDPIMLVGNLSAARDFTDVRDVVRAYRLLLEQSKPGKVYHVASGKAVTIQSLLDMLLAQSVAPISVKQDPDKMRKNDIPVLVGDATLLTQATGWQPEVPLEQSLNDILDYWRAKARTS